MTFDRKVYNKTPSTFDKKKDNTSFTKYKRNEGNEQLGVVMNRFHNCDSYKHLVRYCPVPVTEANCSRHSENTRVNRIQVISDPENPTTGQENLETGDQSVMKCDIQKEILLDDGFQGEVGLVGRMTVEY